MAKRWIWNHKVPNPTVANESAIRQILKEYAKAGVDGIDGLPGARGMREDRLKWLIETSAEAGIRWGARPVSDWSHYDVDKLYKGLYRLRNLDLEYTCSAHEPHEHIGEGNRNRIVQMSSVVTPNIPAAVYYGGAGLFEQGLMWLKCKPYHIAQVGVTDTKNRDWWWWMHNREPAKLLLSRFVEDSDKSFLIINVQHNYDPQEAKRLMKTMAEVEPDYLCLRGSTPRGGDKPLPTEKIKELFSYAA